MTVGLRIPTEHSGMVRVDDLLPQTESIPRTLFQLLLTEVSTIGSLDAATAFTLPSTVSSVPMLNFNTVPAAMLNVTPEGTSTEPVITSRSPGRGGPTLRRPENGVATWRPRSSPS